MGSGKQTREFVSSIITATLAAAGGAVVAKAYSDLGDAAQAIICPETHARIRVHLDKRSAFAFSCLSILAEV